MLLNFRKWCRFRDTICYVISISIERNQHHPPRAGIAPRHPKKPRPSDRTPTAILHHAATIPPELLLFQVTTSSASCSRAPTVPLLLHRRAPFASLSPPRLRWPRLCLPLSSFLLLSPTAIGLILLKLNRGKYSTYAGKIRATPATIFKSPASMTHPPP